jgi:hypothetical protein
MISRSVESLVRAEMKRIAFALLGVGTGVIGFGVTRWLIWRSRPPLVRARITSEEYPEGFAYSQELFGALLLGAAILSIGAFLWTRGKRKKPVAPLL